MVTLLMLMTGEILTCYYITPKIQRPDYAWEEHFETKLVIGTLAIVSLILDSIFIGLFYWLPVVDFESVPLWGSGMLPITLSTLLWLNTAEAARVIRNVSKVRGGAASIPPVIIWVLHQLRKIDEARLPPGVHPNKRMLDNVTEDDIKFLLKRLEMAGELDPAPAPIEKAVEKTVEAATKEEEKNLGP